MSRIHAGRPPFVGFIIPPRKTALSSFASTNRRSRQFGDDSDYSPQPTADPANLAITATVSRDRPPIPPIWRSQRLFPAIDRRPPPIWRSQRLFPPTLSAAASMQAFDPFPGWLRASRDPISCCGAVFARIGALKALISNCGELLRQALATWLEKLASPGAARVSPSPS